MFSKKQGFVSGKSKTHAIGINGDSLSVQPLERTGHYKSAVFVVILLGSLGLGTWVPGPAWGGDIVTPVPEPDPTPPPPPCPTTQSGNPINYFTGAERPTYTDLVIKGEYSIQFRRRYDSQATYDSSMGYGWSHNHDLRLYKYPDNSVIIRHDCGSRTRMVFSGGAYITSPGGLRGALEEVSGDYLFTNLTGRKIYFDAQGRLTAVEDNRGNRLEYSYGATRQALVGTSPFGVDPAQPITVSRTWQLESIQERLADGSLSGNQLTLVYSSTTGRLQNISDQDGRSVTYTHDELDDGTGNILTSGNLVQVEGLEGVISSYQYLDPNDSHNLTGIQKDSQADWVINSYNTDDKVYLQTYDNHTTTFTYVADYIETIATETITDENGLNPVDATDHFCFDDLGYVEQRQDAEGYLKVFIRNSDYLVTREERWSKASDSADIICDPVTDTANRTLIHAVDKEYDIDGRLTIETAQRGDGRSLVTTKTYDGARVASEQTISSDDPTTIFRTEYTFYYDGNGNPTNIKDVIDKRDAVDGGDQITSYIYNSRGQATTVTYPDNSSLNIEYQGGSLYPTRRYFKDANGIALSDLAEDYSYDARGNLKTKTDAATKVTTFDYDNRNRLIKTANPLGEQTIYTYNENNLEQIEVGRTILPDQSIVPGEITRMIYDGKNRLTATQIKQTDGSWLSTATYAYDSRGKRLSVTDANTNATLFGYDRLGRMTSQTDANLYTTLFAYNALGHRTSSTQTATTPPTVTYYSQDNQGNLLSVTDPNTNVTSYSYDAVGNRLSQLSPDTGTTTYEYDTLSNLRSKTDANNDTATYSYDTRNRLEDIAYTDTALNQHYTYNDLGQITTTTDAAGSTGYGYDSRGNLETLSKAMGPITLNTTYGYDAASRMKSMIYHSGKQIDYTLDPLGRAIGATLTDGATVTPLVGNITYRPLGPQTSMDLGNNFQQVRQHDPAYRLLNLTMPVQSADNIAPIVVPPANITVEATALLTSVSLGTASAIDDVDGALTPTPDQSGPFGIGTHIITWSATDSASNIGTATQTVTVQDTTAPILTVPADVNVTAAVPATVDIGTATATDIFNITITNDAPATYTAGATIVTWTATDANGNSTQATQNVTVTAPDTTAPVITPPVNLSVEATALLTSVSLGTASAIDDVDGALTPTPDQSGPFGIGTHIITWSATDSASNIGTATQTVTVQDTTAPVLTAPADVNVTAAVPATVDIGTATATDIFNVTITNDAPATYAEGATVVTWTATDANGNSTQATQNVTVTDVTEGIVDTSYILNYEASSEGLPSDGTWNYITGQTGFDFTISNATLTNSPQSSYSGITQAWQFDGTGGGTMESLQDISGNPADADASFELWIRPTDLIDS
ncbi:MAG: hypothetical protein GY820_25220, partial [Gammaproteobacteria bacterium]|nr:hypothetical protein [Gammaproteobacteria bacterium]